MSGFCIDCGTHVDSFVGLTKCPTCGSTAIPCSDARQVTVNINWQELRVLIMWAEFWQRHKQLGRTVYSIAKRLSAQHPTLAADYPLTFAEELGQVAKNYSIVTNSAALRQDVAEQTGMEIGLVEKKDETE